MIDSERFCFAAYAVFQLRSLSETSFDQLCNEMWLPSTALFNCKNCCELQIHSRDEVQTELLSELWRETPRKPRDCFTCSAPFRRGRERADFAHQCRTRWCQEEQGGSLWKLYYSENCQIILNWENMVKLHGSCMWRADFDMFWIRLG